MAADTTADSRTTTVSMLDRVDQIREEEIPYREEMRGEIREMAREEYEEVWQIPDDVEQRYARLEREIEMLRGRANVLERKAEEFDGDEFRIRELSVGGVGRIQDDVSEASDLDMEGDGTPAVGYARVRTLEVAVAESPPNAPDPADLGEAVGEWLYDCIDEFNSKGEVDLGNSSLRADLMNSTD